MSIQMWDFVEVRKTKERGRITAIRDGDKFDVKVYAKGGESETRLMKKKELRRLPLEELL